MAEKILIPLTTKALLLQSFLNSKEELDNELENLPLEFTLKLKFIAINNDITSINNTINKLTESNKASQALQDSILYYKEAIAPLEEQKDKLFAQRVKIYQERSKMEQEAKEQNITNIQEDIIYIKLTGEINNLTQQIEALEKQIDKLTPKGTKQERENQVKALSNKINTNKDTIKASHIEVQELQLKLKDLPDFSEDNRTVPEDILWTYLQQYRIGKIITQLSNLENLDGNITFDEQVWKQAKWWIKEKANEQYKNRLSILTGQPTTEIKDKYYYTTPAEEIIVAAALMQEAYTDIQFTDLLIKRAYEAKKEYDYNKRKKESGKNNAVTFGLGALAKKHKAELEAYMDHKEAQKIPTTVTQVEPEELPVTNLETTEPFDSI